MTGVVFYEGKSLLDGSPIVGIATWGTHNQKTGDLVQTWILRSDMHPQVAVNDGSDESICGNCPLRGVIRPASERTTPGKYEGDTTNKGRSCYVLIQYAPAGVYNKYKAGNYPVLSDSLELRKSMMGRGLRYGAYGDPVAIPIKYWNKLLKHCSGQSMPGYTHQWKNKKFSSWKTRLMASTHSVEENNLAHSMGWRTFRTVNSKNDVTDLEIVCPASAEGGYKANCATCGACDGKRNDADGRRSIIIVNHGGLGKARALENVIASRSNPV